MENTVIERIKSIIKYYNISDSKFAKSIGVSPSTLSSLFSRNNDPNTGLIKSILHAYSDINLEWIMFGNGEMIISKNENNKGCNKLNIEEDLQVGNPYYAVDFIGGFSSMFNDQTVAPAYYIDYKPFNEANVMYVNLTGDSMKPELNHGDVIAIKEATTPLEYLPYGEIYAIVTDDFRTVKRISRSDKEGFIKLIPTNKQGGYVEQDIPANMIRRVFHVLGSIKNL